MRAYYINGNTDEHNEVDVEPCLSELYRLIGCDCIDIVLREIDGHSLNFVLDDEGLLKPNRYTACAVRQNEMLAGSILVFGVDEYTGDLSALTEEESSIVAGRVIDAVFQDLSTHPVLFYTR